MLNKTKISAFDFVAFIVFLALAFIFWSFMRAISLVQPNEFQLENSQPVEAIEQLKLQPEQAAANQTAVEDITNQFESQLQTVVDEFVATQPNQFGIVVKHLASGSLALHNADQSMTMASLYKPFVAVEALKLVDSGRLSLTQIIGGDGQSVEECVKLSLEVSDNPCGLALLRATNLASDFGLDKLQTLGYKHTDLRGYYPSSSARDVAGLLEAILRGRYLSRDSRQLLIESLLAQKITDRLPAGLPAGTKLAHKTGDLDGYAHDAGIVIRSEGSYVVAVLSGPDGSGRMLGQRYADFGRLVASIDAVMVKFTAALSELSS